MHCPGVQVTYLENANRKKGRRYRTRSFSLLSRNDKVNVAANKRSRRWITVPISISRSRFDAEHSPPVGKKSTYSLQTVQVRQTLWYLMRQGILVNEDLTKTDLQSQYPDLRRSGTHPGVKLIAKLRIHCCWMNRRREKSNTAPESYVQTSLMVGIRNLSALHAKHVTVHQKGIILMKQ